MLVYFEHLYIRICLAILVLGYAGSALHTYYQLRRLPALPDMSGDLLPVVWAYYTLIHEWLRWQNWAAWFFYPISAIGGALIGMAMGGNLEKVLQQSWAWWTLGAAALVLSPLAYLLARYMSRVAFGRYLEHLRSIIDFLEKKD